MMESSIRHNPSLTALPDFRNLGVWLRILLGVNVLGLLWALARNTHFADLPVEFIEAALWLEPPLFLILPLLHLLNPQLANLPLNQGRLAVLALVVIVVTLQHLLLIQVVSTTTTWALLRAACWGLLITAFLLAYFAYLAALYSPALSEARLLALTARIRPHFLYNSLNAVLGVIRHDPRRAEGALEELSDLFRALMKENKELALLSDEIALARQYLELERLRLGERLRVNWTIDACPPDALVPPLVLQPLLENAVYHGIEPATEGAEVNVSLTVDKGRLRLALRNPYHAGHGGRGNQMALANIRERLLLFYDLEASMETRRRDGHYEVNIELPLRRMTEMSPS